MRKTVGISQKIKRAWLDAVLEQLRNTPNEKELRAFLDEYLLSELPGTESRAKASGIVLRVWSRTDPRHVEFRNRALALISEISREQYIWLHWGMTALTYPFFRDVAEVVGRLLALQDDFTTVQVQARIVPEWGDRTTSKEAVQKLITSLVDWGVLQSTRRAGHFLLERKLTADTELQLWLLEVLLMARSAEEIEAHQLFRLPESFPFRFSVSIGDLRKNEAFNIQRQGLDMDMVALRKTKVDRMMNALVKGGRSRKRADSARPNLFGT